MDTFKKYPPSKPVKKVKILKYELINKKFLEPV